MTEPGFEQGCLPVLPERPIRVLHYKSPDRSHFKHGRLDFQGVRIFSFVLSHTVKHQLAAVRYSGPGCGRRWPWTWSSPGRERTAPLRSSRDGTVATWHEAVFFWVPWCGFVGGAGFLGDACLLLGGWGGLFPTHFGRLFPGSYDRIFQQDGLNSPVWSPIPYVPLWSPNVQVSQPLLDGSVRGPGAFSAGRDGVATR